MSDFARLAQVITAQALVDVASDLTEKASTLPAGNVQGASLIEVAQSLLKVAEETKNKV